jgi:hypothetical protein
MALEGTLRDFSLPDILQLIGLQRKTGVLTIRTASDTVTLYFDRGRLVRAHSAMEAPDTKLGYIMVRSGRITQEQLDDALAAQRERILPLGSILLERGACSTAELSMSISIQQKRLLFSLFRLEEGVFIFDPAESVEYEEGIIVPLDIEMLLMEAAQMLDEQPMVEKVIRSVDIVFRRSDVARHAGVLDEREAAVLDMIDGERSVGDILSRTLMSEYDCYKALYNFASRGLIEEVNGRVVDFDLLNALPSVDEFIEKMRGLVPSRCLDLVEALPASAFSNAVILIVSISMQSVLWSPDDSAFDEWIEPLDGIIAEATRLYDLKTGVYESVTGNIGLAVFWDFESDFALMVSDALAGKSGVSKFRSQVARMASRLLPS